MKTILLVDDDEALRLTYATALRRKDYHVIEANSGVEALRVARQHLPDLILSDMHMPGGDGATLLHDIRLDPELRSKQVVLMTGNPELVTPRRVMEDGADDFLVKPVSLHDLFASIEARFKRAFISWRVEDEMLSQLRTAMPSQLPHEIFTPLAGIIGLLEIVRSDSSGLNPAEINEIHEDMYLSAFRLHRTLRNYLLLLDLQNSAVESTGGGLDPRRVEESVRGGVTSALRLNKRKEDIGIRVEECSLAVKAGDLTQIVEELVDNACKFSRQGTPIEVILSAAGELTVSDKGRGMTAEQITRIGLFRQFERQKHEQQGLGLGLVLVQKLAARSHANLLVESELGHGTRAIVSFTKITI